MTWMNMVGPLLALLGVIAGALFTRNREAEKYRKDRLTEVYSKYVTTFSESSSPLIALAVQKAQANMQLNQEEVAAIVKHAQSWNQTHANILIYGSQSVISALSDFYDRIHERSDQVNNEGMIAVITAMRRDIDPKMYPRFPYHVDNVIGARAEARKAALAPGLVQPPVTVATP